MKKQWLYVVATLPINSNIPNAGRLIYIIKTTDIGVRRCFSIKMPVQRLFRKNISSITKTENIDIIMKNYCDEAHKECADAMSVGFIIKKYGHYGQRWKSMDKEEVLVNQRNRFRVFSKTTFVKGVDVYLIYDNINRFLIN